MRIRIHSDLHLEFHDWTPPDAPADVVILAGDIHVGSRAFAWARRHFRDLPVIYVAGNHEYFGSVLDTMLAELRQAAQQHDIQFLERDAIVLDGIRFLGTTLWTDFELYGREPAQIEAAMRSADHDVDYRLIKWSPTATLKPEHTRQMHLDGVVWLQNAIATRFDGPTVVVTHHLPHPDSVHDIYQGVPSNPQFASDLSRLFDDSVRLWVHGHTHESMNYQVGHTQVVCNPRGYIPKYPNLNFDPTLSVEVTR